MNKRDALQRELALIDKVMGEVLSTSGSRKGKKTQTLIYEAMLAQAGRGNAAAARLLMRLSDEGPSITAAYEDLVGPSALIQYARSGLFTVKRGFTFEETMRFVHDELSAEELAEIKARPITHPAYIGCG